MFRLAEYSVWIAMLVYAYSPSVIAQTRATVYRLAREPFLTAVLGHAATQRQAHTIVDAQLAADVARGNDPGAADVTDPG